MTMSRGIAVRDTILWVEDSGEADLPPVICLHSLFLDGTMFQSLTEACAGRFRVIRPDFRGQGSSAPATGDTVGMDECAEDMLALIKEMRLAPVNLAAASMGGYVAVRMAARRPNLFASMVMMGSSVRGEPADQKAHFAAMLNSAYAAGFAGDDLELLMSIMFGRTIRANAAMQPLLDHWRTKLRLLPRSCWPAMKGVLERESAAPLLADVKTPTLIFSGEEDIARPPEWAREVTDGIGGSRLVPLLGVGHSPILETPDFVIPRALAFMPDPQIGAWE